MKKVLNKLKKPQNLRIFLSIIIAIIVILSVIMYEKRQGRVQIDNSVVSAPIISIAPETPGKLLLFPIYENELVKKGDVLAVVGSQTLRADTDGLIITANNQIGGLASATSPVTQLIRLDDMRIAGTVDENKGLNAIHVGQIASFTIDALPGRKFWGYVDEISPSAKQTQLSFAISSERPTQQFVVYIRFDARRYPEIKNGMSAKLTIFTRTN